MSDWQFGIAFIGIFLAGCMSGFLLQRWLIGVAMIKAFSDGAKQMKAAVDDLATDRKAEAAALDGLIDAARGLNAQTADLNGRARERA